MPSTAYLLVIHGSRDPRPHLAAQKLAQLVHQRLAIQNLSFATTKRLKAPEKTFLASKKQFPLVATASLELASIPLHKRIAEVAKQAQAANCQRLKILPLFLLPGVHVKEDIPIQVQLAQQAIGKHMELQLKPYLGTHPHLIELLAQKLSQLSNQAKQAKILLSHGSHRPGSKQMIEQMAQKLGAVAAYCSVAPSLQGQVTMLVESGEHNIAILPYFLFTGKITDAIASQVEQLRQTYPQVQFYLGEPLGSSHQLAQLVTSLCQ